MKHHGSFDSCKVWEEIISHLCAPDHTVEAPEQPRTSILAVLMCGLQSQLGFMATNDGRQACMEGV